jgi:hypothetical protein
MACKEAIAGAVAFSRRGDPNVGEFEDAVILKAFGEVPDDLLGSPDPAKDERKRGAGEWSRPLPHLGLGYWTRSLRGKNSQYSCSLNHAHLMSNSLMPVRRESARA